MGRRDHRGSKFPVHASRATPPSEPHVPLLDLMIDGQEYQSLVDHHPQVDIRDELRRAIAEVEAVRGRPLLLYVGNVVKPMRTPVSIVLSDDLPFSEMVRAVPAEARAVDILLLTPGGLAQQVSLFVSKLRPRFESVSFIVPNMALSAGTIWCLSGDEIWMTKDGYLGPIDPQVSGKDGNFLPAQAIIGLLQEIQRVGDENIQKGQSPPWSYVELLRNMDPKELGNAWAMTDYSIQLASEYLTKYKFSDWPTHRDGRPVTPEERTAQALSVAQTLCNHGKWKVHSHGITRDVARQELGIRISHPETVPAFDRALRRLWALLYFSLEASKVAKMFLSANYSLFRIEQEA